MNILYRDEHLACFQYDDGKNPAIERIERTKGRQFQIFNDVNKIVFVLKGIIAVSFDKQVNKEIREGEFFFVPSKSQYSSLPKEDSVVLIFRLNMSFNFCDHFSFEMLLDKNGGEKTKESFTKLTANNLLGNYLNSLEIFLLDELKCFYFLELKLKELLFLLRAYYSKDELYALFTSVLSADVQFSNKVFEYCEKVKSSKELAEIMNYSLSGFEKRFKRVFGVPAYQWLKMRKARNIYHEISCTKRTFAEIAFQYGFSSPSYFNDFSKANFGRTPGEIREQTLSSNNKI